MTDVPDRPAILVEFGSRVKSIRRAKSLSQTSLAEIAGLHRTYIGMIERAEKNVTIVNVEKIACALGVSVASLFEK